jgi:hypothetical protein
MFAAPARPVMPEMPERDTREEICLHAVAMEDKTTHSSESILPSASLCKNTKDIRGQHIITFTSTSQASSSSRASDVQFYTAVLFEPIRQQHYSDRLKDTRASPGCHPNISPCCANAFLTCAT